MQKKFDEISFLFARGPRNNDEVAILDAHIQQAAKQIRDSWSDDEREARARKAGSPCRVPYNPNNKVKLSGSMTQLIDQEYV